MEQYKTGDIIQVTVTAIRPFGVFVTDSNNIDGFIHISEISDDYVKNISSYVVVGERILVKIIDINERGQLKLSLKAIKSSRKRYRKGEKMIIPDEKSFQSLKEMLPLWIRERLEREKNKEQ